MDDNKSAKAARRTGSSVPWRGSAIYPLLSVAAFLIMLALAGCSGEAAIGPQTAVAYVEPVTPATPTTLPTATFTPTSAPTVTPLPTLTPSPTLTPTPTATPAPQPVRLTEGGCCTQPFWSPDGAEVRFIDRLPDDPRVGIWGVALAEPGSVAFVTERVEASLSDGDYLVETTANTTTIERLSDGARWTVPARGERVGISPGQTRIAWIDGNDSVSPDQQVNTVWVANLDGSEARKLVTLRRGGLSGWISDDALLVSGRESATATDQVLWAAPLNASPPVELARAERLRSSQVSPSGAWVAYYVTFDADPARNGLWIARTDGSNRRQIPQELFGSYQWRGCPGVCDPAEAALLIVPLQPGAAYHELWQVRAAGGEPQRLTDLAVTPFKIANGDWRVSPDGRYVAYVESEDRNIWALPLPE